jgi:hypothetical protein
VNHGVRRTLRRAGLVDVAKTARQRGWTIELTRKGHLKFVHRTGALVYTGGSPSDHRARHNLAADLHRAEQTLDETRR